MLLIVFLRFLTPVTYKINTCMILILLSVSPMIILRA